MSAVSKIKNLLQNQAIWQASDKQKVRPVASTGYSQLDKQLHYSGWPQGCLSELLLSNNGIGEIRLLSPLIASLNRQAGYIGWINPPYLPYAPALAAQGLQLDKMLLIRTTSLQDTIWSAQQAMASKACAAVLVWLPKKQLTTEIRKLSLATKAGNCWGFIIRDHHLQQQASSAALRLVMQTQSNKQQLEIIKQPGGWSGQKISLNLFPERVNWTSLVATHWPAFMPKKDPKESPQEEFTESKLFPQQAQNPGFAKQALISPYH